MANPGTGARADEAGVDLLRKRHVAAVNAGDADGWADCFTDDGVQMPPNFAANAGKPALRGWIQGFLSMFACQFGLSVEEVQVAANWAFERGRYAITLTPKAGGGPLDDRGKYITIYQRQPDGAWKTLAVSQST